MSLPLFYPALPGKGGLEKHKGVIAAMKRADFFGGLIGILIGIYAIWEALRMPPDYVMKIGPGFFPIILAGFLILFSIVLLINAQRGHSKGSLEPLKLSDKGVQRGLITLGAAVVFCFLFKPLGFILTSLLFLVFMMFVLGRRKPLMLALAPAIVTASIWLVFEKALNLSLPQGILASILGG